MKRTEEVSMLKLPIGIAIVLLMLAMILPASAQDVTPFPTPTLEGPVVNLEEAAEGAVNATEAAAQATASGISNLVARLLQPPRSEVVRFLLIVGGIILLFVGWRVYEFIIIIAGFLIGAAFATALVDPTNTVWTIGAFLIGGLIGAALSIFVYYIAVFLIGGYIGIVLTEGAVQALGFSPVSSIVLFIMALIGGLILVGLSFELLLILSVLVGAQMVALGLGLGIEWTLIFAALGILVQFIAARTTGYRIRRRPVWRNPLRRVWA